MKIQFSIIFFTRKSWEGRRKKQAPYFKNPRTKNCLWYLFHHEFALSFLRLLLYTQRQQPKSSNNNNNTCLFVPVIIYSFKSVVLLRHLLEATNHEFHHPCCDWWVRRLYDNEVHCRHLGSYQNIVSVITNPSRPLYPLWSFRKIPRYCGCVFVWILLWCVCVKMGGKKRKCKNAFVVRNLCRVSIDILSILNNHTQFKLFMRAV